MKDKNWKPEAAILLDSILTRVLSRRAEVEKTLLDMANGKKPMPDASKLRELARELGDPTSQEAMAVQAVVQRR